MPCQQITNTDISYSPPLSSRTGPFATEADCLNACKEGACCEGTTCSIKPQCQCQGAGKTFNGVGTTCTPSPCTYCCTQGPLPTSLEFVISGFTSSRGSFANWNPNRSFSLATPEVGFSQTGEPGHVYDRSCVCFSDYGYVNGYDIFGSAISSSTCALYRTSLPAGATPWTLLYSIAIGASDGSSECAHGNTISNNTVGVRVWIQDRTTGGNDETLLSVVRATNLTSLSTGLTRQQFIDAVCGGTLAVSGYVSTAFSTFVSGVGCVANSGSVSFDWQLRTNPLP